MTIDVVTTVDVEIDVVVVEDELVVVVVGISVVVVDEVAAVVVGVDSVDIAEVEDEITVVLGIDVVDSVDGVVDTVVRVELSIGKNLIALAVVILEITPATARKRISANTIRTAADFIQLSLLKITWHTFFPVLASMVIQMPHSNYGP